MSALDSVDREQEQVATRAANFAAALVRQHPYDAPERIGREINWLRSVITKATARIRALEKHLESPRVLVVLHYKQYRSPMTSDAAEGYTLEYAYHLLYHLTLDNGTGWPTGIEVGGCMVTWDELIAEFGEYDPW